MWLVASSGSISRNQTSV